MNPLFRQFLVESRELIEQAGAELLLLERQPGDRACLDRVFRSVHTLKGSVGLFNWPPLGDVLHAAEDLLAAVRTGTVSPAGVAIDPTLEALDQVARWIDGLEAEETLPADAPRIAAGLVARIRRPLEAEARRAPAPEADLGWLRDLPAEARRRAAAVCGDGPAVLVSYDPDPRCFFNGDDPLNTFRKVPGLAALQVRSRADWPPPERLDPFDCNLRIRALAAAAEDAVAQPFRFVADQVRLVPVTAAALRAALAEPEPQPQPPPDIVAAILAEQVRMLAAVPDDPGLDGCIAAAGRAAVACLAHAGDEARAAAVTAAAERAAARRDRGELASVLERVLCERTAEPAAPPQATSRVLRVDQARVDGLVDLVSELIVAKNALPLLAARAEDEFGAPALGRAIAEQHATLDRLVREMHHGVLRVRMLPVGQAFQRFPRIVRDMARQLDKSVELALDDQGVEADKVVVDALGDPLLHLVRNALDHGIETPAERNRAGKPLPARLVLRASREGERVVVEVRDDGRGIDAAEIRAAALRRGVVAPDAAAALSDEEALQLIFAPGFTTRGAASALSGRGVGLDAVRTALQQAGGRIAVASEPGQGATFRLTLPLSMTLSRIMVVKVGRQRFGIPISSVAETTRVAAAGIRRVRNADAFVLRGSVVPLLSVSDLLDIDRDATPGDRDASVVVVETSGGPAGLVVDGFGERLEVVLRPLDGVLAGLRGYLGTTVLGDGGVLLVLDVEEIVR